MIKLQQVMKAMRNISNDVELSDAQFGELTELIGIPSMIIDGSGRILCINETTAAMLGFKADEIRATLLADCIFEGGDDLRGILHPGLQSAKPAPFDLVFQGRSGRKTALCVVPQTIPHADGAAHSILLVLTEKTKRSALAQALHRSQPALQQFSNRLMAAHELELKRVSSELHDDIGQVLTMIKFMVEDAARQINNGALAAGNRILDDTVARLREAMNEVRRVSSELRPSSLDDLGLLPTIEWHCRNYQNAYRFLQLKLDLNVIEAEIPGTLKLDIFRIIQESLNNAAKHANASEVKVSLQVEQACLHLGIQDNGAGFDVNLVDAGIAGQGGIGLKSMLDRVESAGGMFLVRSDRNRGTTLNARWTLPAAA
jgi:two-component system NarL family sensor kinase